MNGPVIVLCPSSCVVCATGCNFRPVDSQFTQAWQLRTVELLQINIKTLDDKKGSLISTLVNSTTVVRSDIVFVDEHSPQNR